MTKLSVYPGGDKAVKISVDRIERNGHRKHSVITITEEGKLHMTSVTDDGRYIKTTQGTFNLDDLIESCEVISKIRNVSIK